MKPPKSLTKKVFITTGDVGYKDEDGHFFITDRKKDLFKLSNGKYVAPQQVESLLNNRRSSRRRSPSVRAENKSAR
jgi:long-chain acyl-CoA synthetase